MSELKDNTDCLISNLNSFAETSNNKQIFQCEIVGSKSREWGTNWRIYYRNSKTDMYASGCGYNKITSLLDTLARALEVKEKYSHGTDHILQAICRHLSDKIGSTIKYSFYEGIGDFNLTFIKQCVVVGNPAINPFYYDINSYVSNDNEGLQFSTAQEIQAYKEKVEDEFCK